MSDWRTKGRGRNHTHIRIRQKRRRRGSKPVFKNDEIEEASIIFVSTLLGKPTNPILARILTTAIIKDSPKIKRLYEEEGWTGLTPSRLWKIIGPSIRVSLRVEIQNLLINTTGDKFSSLVNYFIK